LASTAASVMLLQALGAEEVGLGSRRRFILALGLAATAAITLFGIQALGAGPYPNGNTGFDISFPQCGATLPSPPSFAIIGVNHGRPFTQNTCLNAEFTWASQGGSVVTSLHMNLSYPTGSTGSQGLTSPLGDCSRSDKACQARNYGYNAAAYAVDYARTQGVASSYWWLDIETANQWMRDTSLNAKVIEGALTYFRNSNLTAGVYSTAYQWAKITGGYLPSPPPPIWIAGTANRAQAAAFCSDSTKAFAGGTPWLVQYVTTLDEDYAC
jgi:hypothetical protein